MFFMNKRIHSKYNLYPRILCFTQNESSVSIKEGISEVHSINGWISHWAFYKTKDGPLKLSPWNKRSLWAPWAELCECGRWKGGDLGAGPSRGTSLLPAPWLALSVSICFPSPVSVRSSSCAPSQEADSRHVGALCIPANTSAETSAESVPCLIDAFVARRNLRSSSSILDQPPRLSPLSGWRFSASLSTLFRSLLWLKLPVLTVLTTCWWSTDNSFLRGFKQWLQTLFTCSSAVTHRTRHTV